MTTERDEGHGPYKPVDQSYLEMLGRGEFSYRRTINLSRELLHLRERTATLESQLSELEMANSRLEGDSLDLHEKIDEWKAACGLNDAHGDPGGIEPRHLIELLRVLRHESDVVRRLDVLVAGNPDGNVDIRCGVEYPHPPEESGYIVCICDGEDDFTGTGPTLTAAIDAALREVEA